MPKYDKHEADDNRKSARQKDKQKYEHWLLTADNGVCVCVCVCVCVPKTYLEPT